MNRRQFICAGTALTSLCLVGCKPSADSAVRLRTQFGWLFDAHHAGFIVALQEGLYESAKLDSTLLPGGTEANPLRMVVSSAAEVGQAGGIEQMITALVEGLPLRPFAAIHQKSPHALISTERRPIRTPADLRGKRIAVAYGDAAEILLKAFLRQNGISQSDVELVPFRFDITPLLQGRVDAVTGFRTDQPATMMAQGVKPVVLAYDDFGISSYGYTLFTGDAFAQSKGEVISRFIAASRTGWERAFGDPNAALDHLQRFLGSPIDRRVEIAKLNLVRDVMLAPGGRLADWSILPDRLGKVVGYLEAEGQIGSSVDKAKLVQQLVARGQ